MKKFGQIIAVICAAMLLLTLVSCGKSTSERTSYEITCSLDGNLLTATQKVSFVNTTDNALDELKFNLYGNAFGKDAKYKPIATQYQASAYPNGMSYGNMDILSVTSAGKRMDFNVGGQDNNLLIVKLNEEVYPDECVALQIEFTLTLADVIARTGVNDKTINLANFYPILCALDENGFYECVYYSAGDPFYSDCADYKVTLTCDQEYVVASSGKVFSANNANGKSTVTYKIDNARSFCFVLSKEYESVTQTVDGVTVNYYYYQDSAPDKSLEYAVKSLKLFNKKFGAYPYPTYSVTQTKFVQGGMEFPALVMISDSLEPNAYGEVIVHETAHQWWQTAVGNNEIKYGFLDEGLAEYSVVIFYENYPEYKLNRETLIKSTELTYKTFCSVYDKLYGTVDTTMLRSLGEFKSEYEYVNIAYIKSCLMYDYLRQTVGEERFFKGLQKYYKEFCFKNATPDDLVGCYEKCGADTNGFFKSFFEGKVII